MKKITTILIILLIASSGYSQDLAGNWNGNLEVQSGRKLLFVFQITKTADKLESEIAIPSQGVKGIKAASTTYEDGHLLIDASNVGFKYSGKWNASTGTIEGTFQEGVNAVPLVLTKEAVEVIKLNRPQEPTKPYPYYEEEVTFHNEKDNITLVGTLTLPKRTGRKPPVVVLISGSGPQDRNQSFASHKTFLVLSDYLTRNGIAVLRYDDRGFGESTGNFAEGTTVDFATDVLSAIEYLKKRQDIDINKIGLIGHSEGAIIAPMVANQSKDLAFIVLLAGTGTKGKEVSLTQAIDYRNFPVPDEKEYEAYVKKAIDIASSAMEIDIVKSELTAFYKNSELLASLLPPNVEKDEFIENLVSTRTTPWVRYFYNYNPATEIRKISVPALVLYGSNDTQVPPKYHLQPVKDALALSKSKKYEVVLLEGLNHLFQESKTGLISEYSQIEQTFAPQALEKISTWILTQTK
ncbi:alpha/beta hydrolase family protein [Gelidibacter japonicus]|uniref:alpha/beta hydrolase family protein n=1 Tax=Gelidibacter japonicus TaxID=1962232 RepID=UPI0013D6D033|nr:alpha/beta hydrolase [Gelidibacter japonicus]